MRARIRRLVLVALVGGAVGAVALASVRLRTGRQGSTGSGAATWPPVDPGRPSPREPEAFVTHAFAAVADAFDPHPDAGDAGTAAGDARPARWVAPVDGACPVSHPVKANDNSRIFHLPGGRSYDRTIPERCYADAADAAADGYRAAKA